ncbi:hypothetical protein CSOJ01_05718 [Colletotrichum sojae]|uniref:Uncharacterized protein n=1 Tax=Colletotrichum sojae TaxID=2175907 RepID=A0A8H6MX39_9PEZI|nr:hypothetical protein CSOJ01_05718 [Colletotrichum sojae]
MVVDTSPARRTVSTQPLPFQHFQQPPIGRPSDVRGARKVSSGPPPLRARQQLNSAPRARRRHGKTPPIYGTFFGVSDHLTSAALPVAPNSTAASPEKEFVGSYRQCQSIAIRVLQIQGKAIPK